MIARAPVVVVVSMLLSTSRVPLYLTPLVHLVMVLNTCGSQLVLLNSQKPALLLVVSIAHQAYLPVLLMICAWPVSRKHVVACGDLNVDSLDTDHPHTKSLQNFILSHSLSCPITFPLTFLLVVALLLTTFSVPLTSPSLWLLFLTVPSRTIYLSYCPLTGLLHLSNTKLSLSDHL